MPAKITNFYSITYRPRGGINDGHENKFRALVNDSRFEVNKYLATIEKDGTPAGIFSRRWF